MDQDQWMTDWVRGMARLVMLSKDLLGSQRKEVEEELAVTRWG